MNLFRIVRAFVAVVLLLTFSSCSTHETKSERELFFENNPEVEAYYEDFNLTSKESELYHALDRNIMLWHLAKNNPEPERDPDDLLKAMNENTETFWNEFSEGVPSGAELYFVSFFREDEELTGYYYLLNGRVIKKDIYEW
jgi:hypothetical protein